MQMFMGAEPIPEWYAASVARVGRAAVL